METFWIFVEPLVLSCGWGKIPDQPPPRVLSFKIRLEPTVPNRYVTCMVFKTTANDRRKKLAPCHDKFDGPRSGTADQVTLATAATYEDISIS
ncbi:hypothetical protein TNCV_1384371 [Trichonephila clavipes]|nr:hypothetical protein TNCV_1384371 [Trichonephila clavipes]